MPASGGDPVVSALRIGFSACGNGSSTIDNGIETSAKRVLQTRVEYEPAANFQNKVLNQLQSKYIALNTRVAAPNGKLNGVNGVNGVNKKAGAQLPVPKKTLYPTEKVQLGFRGSLSVGSGMINLGNTCYLNSTLQALFHVPAFVNWLLSDPAHKNCVQNSDYQMHQDDVICAVIKTFKCSQQKTGTAMKPLCIYSKLKAICKHLSQGSQEDAHEFMRYLLESLEKAFLTKVQGHSLESWSKETTPVNQIFGGYIRTEVVCLICRAVSTTFQHFQDLSLDIRRASTLDDALSAYFERERLPDGEDAYKCDKCGRKVAATKKFSMERPPNVLCVQLKRMMNGKLTKQVQLPQQLDLTRFVSVSVQPRHPVRYRLVSLVTHMGQSANCGHYTAIALAANGSYYQFDDGSVRQIPLSTVLNMSAYLVLYELERPFPPHSPRPAASSSADSTAQKESESASVGGCDAKEPATSGSPTAGSPAPRTSPAPATTSLVPYESDADSDAENKEMDTAGSWKVTPVKARPQPPPIATCTTPWRVTDTQPASRRTETPTAGTPLSGAEARSPIAACGAGDKARSPSAARETTEQVQSESAVRGSQQPLSESGARPADSKRRDIVTELMQNSHRGYGSNQVRTWNGLPSNMERQVEQERRENRKRTYDDEYNADFDRGKTKKKRSFEFGRDTGRGRYNPFQQRTNEQNAWRQNRFDYPKFPRSNHGNNWGYRRHYHKNHYNNNKHYNNYPRY